MTDTHTLELDLSRLGRLDSGDGDLRVWAEALAARITAAGYTPAKARLSTNPAGLVDGTIRLELELGTDELLVVTVDERELDNDRSATLVALLVEVDDALEATDPPAEPTAGADSPLTAPTGERLLDEDSYAGMRRAVLDVSRALGAVEEDLFAALVATAKRSIGPGLEQAVAAGDIPVDSLAGARQALELELDLFEAAVAFRNRIGRVQDRVRAHLATEEANAGAPPAIEVIRHNAGQNGGGA